MSNTPSPTVTATASPTPKPTEPFLVVLGPGLGGVSGPATLTILDMAGGKHASVNFTAPEPPRDTNAIVSVQPPATAAAGKAYYIDSTGAVHSVTPDGRTVQVAQFPLQAGDEISFAVSPDASRILAVVNRPVGLTFRSWQTWVYADALGAGTQLLAGPVVSSSILRLFGWTPGGLVAITDAALGFQGCEIGDCDPFGHAALIDPTTGAVNSAVGGSDCEVWDIVGSAVLCSSGPKVFATDTPANLSIRAFDGSGARPVPISPRCMGCYYDARLSPGGNVSVQVLTAPAGANDLNTFVIHQDGSATKVALPQADPGGRGGEFGPYIWFGDHTIVGVTDCSTVGCDSSGGSLASVDITAANPQPVALGVRGNPVATLTA